MIHEKTLKPKISCHRPFKVLFGHLVKWGGLAGEGGVKSRLIRFVLKVGSFWNDIVKGHYHKMIKNNFMPPNVFQCDFDWSKSGLSRIFSFIY
jgi:hypothetical protein